jgi:tRNA dimethylallyltransferase
MAAPLCVLLGPTAAGKTAVSLPLAERLGGEIVSVDSRQLYRGMEIGSAAPSPEERARVPHHLVAEEDPRRPWSAGEYGRRAREVIATIEAHGKIALLVGGSGLYLRAVLGGLDEGLPRDESLRKRLRERVQTEGIPALHAELARLDPASAARISPRDAQRVTRSLEIVLAGGRPAAEVMTRGRGSEAGARIAVLDRTREELEARIRARVGAMIREGLEGEVRALLERGIDPASPVMKGVGFAETVRLLRGDLDRTAWAELIAVNTRRYAKRQRTWFRSLTGAVWFTIPPEERPEETAGRVAAGWDENDGTSAG